MDELRNALTVTNREDESEIGYADLAILHLPHMEDPSYYRETVANIRALERLTILAKRLADGARDEVVAWRRWASKMLEEPLGSDDDDDYIRALFEQRTSVKVHPQAPSWKDDAERYKALWMDVCRELDDHKREVERLSGVIAEHVSSADRLHELAQTQIKRREEAEESQRRAIAASQQLSAKLRDRDFTLNSLRLHRDNIEKQRDDFRGRAMDLAREVEALKKAQKRPSESVEASIESLQSFEQAHHACRVPAEEAEEAEDLPEADEDLPEADPSDFEEPESDHPGTTFVSEDRLRMDRDLFEETFGHDFDDGQQTVVQLASVDVNLEFTYQGKRMRVVAVGPGTHVTAEDPDGLATNFHVDDVAKLAASSGDATDDVPGGSANVLSQMF